MPALLRILLWIAALLAPGGFLLLPFLAAGSLRRKASAAAPNRERDA